MNIFPSCFFPKKAITPNENLRRELAKHKLHSLALNAVTNGNIGQKFEKMLVAGKKNLFLGTTLPEDIINGITHQAQESEACKDIGKKTYFIEQKRWILYQLIKEILNDDMPEDKQQDYFNDKLAYNIDKYVLKSSLSNSKIIKKFKDDHKHHYTVRNTTVADRFIAFDISQELSTNKKFAKSFCQEILKPIIKDRKQNIKNLDPTSPHPEIDLYLSDKNLFPDLRDSILAVLNNQKNELTYDYIIENDSDTLRSFLKVVSTLEHLKKLTLCQQGNLVALNEISHIKQLEELDLDNTTIPTTIGDLKYLNTLHIKDSYTLKSLPEEICKVENLKTFNLDARSVTQLPNNIGDLKQLETFKIDCYDLKTLPETVYNLESLKNLHIRSNEITNLSKKIKNFKNLEELQLRCNKIKELPEEISDLKNLKTLNVDSLQTLPDTIVNCTSLTKIHISSENFQELPKKIGDLKNLETLYINSSKGLTSLPDTINKCTSLTNLSINNTGLQGLPENIGDLTSLTDITLIGNENLTRLPDSISKLTNLRNLRLRDTNIRYDTIPEALLRNNPDIYIDINPANQNIRGAQNVHAQPIEDRTKDIILFLEKKYPIILPESLDNQPLPEVEKLVKKELQNNTIKSIKQTLQKELEKYNNIPNFISADDAIEKKPDPEDTSNIRYFYETNDSQKNTLVKVIAPKDDKEITYLQPTKKWKILAALRECDFMLAQQDLAHETYNPKEIFTLVMQFLKDMTIKDELEEKDMINNVIDTLYDNRRTYNSAPIDNEAPLDDQQKRDLVSCIPGCVNRIALMAGLHIDIKPALPSSKDYNEKYLFIMRKILKDIFHNSLPPQNVTPEDWEKIKDGVLEEEAITPALWNIIGNNIRETLHKEYEYCGLNKENDQDLWKSTEDSYQDSPIVDIINTKGKKPVQEKTFVPNISSEQGSSSSHS